MEEKLAFESFLYGDGNEININDMEFCADRIIMMPKIRPHRLEKAVSLSVEYCCKAGFRQKLLEKSNECPTLIYQLFKRGEFVYGEIEPFLMNLNSFLLCYSFRKQIKDFGSFIKRKEKPYAIDESFFENEKDIDEMIEYGFLPSTIEYILKYDVIDDLYTFNILNKEAKWSPFEWSFKPKYLDFLSFSGYFGSIKCFKNLLMNGCQINKRVISMVFCNGSLDLFHLCQDHEFLSINRACFASEFFHIALLDFIKENQFEVDSKDKYGLSPLHYAAQNGHLSVVEYLVNQKADINAKNYNVEF